MNKFERDFGFQDGPSHYPNSCVHYTRLGTFELRQLFAYLRQREEVIQREIQTETKSSDGFRWTLDQLAKVSRRAVFDKIRLREVEAFLSFIAANFPEVKTKADQEQFYELRVRRGEVPGIQKIQSKFRAEYEAQGLRRIPRGRR